jgi:hypothetical protein
MYTKKSWMQIDEKFCSFKNMRIYETWSIKVYGLRSDTKNFMKEERIVFFSPWKLKQNNSWGINQLFSKG